MYKHVHIVIDHLYTKQLYDFIQSKFNDHYFIVVDLELDTGSAYFSNASLNIRKCTKSEIKSASTTSELYHEISAFKNIFIHYLYNFYCDFFVNLPFNKSNLYWIVWGADLYDYIPFEIYDDNVKRMFPQSVNKPKYSELFLKNRALLISKLSGICTTSVFDYNLIKQFYETQAPRIELGYNTSIYLNEAYCLSMKEIEGASCIRVLVGNSGDISNNHQTIFEYLDKLLPSDSEVIVPLSYGNREHIEEIKRIGKMILKNRMIPLEQFMIFEEYVQLISKVNCIVMNHRRQQAVGNVLIGLYLGKAVFLSETSPVYYDLIDKGFIIYKAGMLNNISLEQFSEICSLKYDQNKERLKTYLGAEYVEQQYSNFFLDFSS
ncbi:TDP-N-acetylfucosamine:lipid II N-acetylfucosaminyltransferase [Paenibacillus montaniterrae]|uniref:TDP-N-acetylfucosamine:lipid II N-acetylfucosaminyltransferase n=1 Tax=Paenibacillus montaniterrae TaxID=429341 RepID=UPI001BCC629A|nr:TDP-N-acetylfucosamine:lipid II N-acetylfucosaminyltransferase [Paenibacillus montaniterrae]